LKKSEKRPFCDFFLFNHSTLSLSKVPMVSSQAKSKG
jgi:hypothetical protein